MEAGNRAWQPVEGLNLRRDEIPELLRVQIGRWVQYRRFRTTLRLQARRATRESEEVMR